MKPETVIHGHTEFYSPPPPPSCAASLMTHDVSHRRVTVVAPTCGLANMSHSCCPMPASYNLRTTDTCRPTEVGFLAKNPSCDVTSRNQTGDLKLITRLARSDLLHLQSHPTIFHSVDAMASNLPIFLLALSSCMLSICARPNVQGGITSEKRNEKFVWAAVGSAYIV